MSKFLVNIFMLNTRVIVNAYTVVTLPLYYAIQKPWKTLEEAKRLRVKKFTTTDGQVVWTRDEERVSHPCLKYHSYAEVMKNLTNIYDPNREALGEREVLKETVEKDENGNIIKIEGKILRKFILSDTYKWLTFGQVLQRVDNIAKGMRENGIKSGDQVILWADTRLEWTLCALALMKLNATLTTLFSNLGTAGLIYAINETESKTIVTAFDLMPKLKTLLKDVPNIRSIIYMKNKNDVFSDDTFPQEVSVKALEELESIGSQMKSQMDFELPANPNERAVIMYTSGTTGTPKAVCISHKQLMASFKNILSANPYLAREPDRHLAISYLPLAHIFGLTSELFALFLGIKIGYSSPFTLLDASPGLTKGQTSDIKLLRPTAMISVPLVLERILKEIYEKFNARAPILSPLFTYLMEYKTRWKGRGFETPIVNKLLCKRIGEAFGGNLEYMVVGGAPLNPRTHALMKGALNFKQIVQGYGLTESSGAIVGMPFNDLSFGRIGIPLEDVYAKLDDWPEGGYLASDRPNPRGELLISSDVVALGYHKMSELTDETFVTDRDGRRWLKTGDIAEVYTDGSIKIIDRKKDLLKLSNGEYISLGKIESVLKSCPLVDNICVVAKSDHNFVSALVTPNNKSLLNLAKQLSKAQNLTREQLCKDRDICGAVMDSLVNSAGINGLHRIETPVKLVLCWDEWTTDNNLITAAFKLKRNNIHTFYRNQIKDLFQ